MPPTPNRSDTPPTAIDPETSERIRGKARQLAARLKLPPTDLPDLEQDLTLHVWARLGRYDPARQDRAVFARMLVGHAAATVFRGRERYTRRAPESLDAVLRAARAPDGPDEPDEPRAWPEPQRRHALALDVAAVLAALPRPLRRVAEALKMRSVADAARHLRLSRAAVYRRLAALRAAFADAGLDEFCAPKRTPRARRG